MNPVSALFAAPAQAVQHKQQQNREARMEDGGISKKKVKWTTNPKDLPKWNKPVKPIPPQYVDNQRGKGLSAARMRALREATDKHFDEKAKRFEYTPQTKQRRFVEELKPQSQDKRRKDMVPQSKKRDDGFNYKKGGIAKRKRRWVR